MTWKNLLLAASAGAALCGTTSAFAQPPGWAPAYGWRGEHRHHFRHEDYRPQYYPPVRIVPPPVYYAPPPPVIVPAPAVVYPPAFPPAGVRVSIGFRL